MEFYRRIAASQCPESALWQDLTITNTTRYCALIETVHADHGEHGNIECHWGNFDIHRQAIKNGIRFSLPACPNALAWTITTDTENRELCVHATINKTRHSPEFIASLEAFLDAWQAGLEKHPL